MISACTSEIPISSVLVFGGLRWQPNFLPCPECVFGNYLLLLASLISFGFAVTVNSVVGHLCLAIFWGRWKQLLSN
jgi:hypothetical protein